MVQKFCVLSVVWSDRYCQLSLYCGIKYSKYVPRATLSYKELSVKSMCYCSYNLFKLDNHTRTHQHSRICHGLVSKRDKQNKIIVIQQRHLSINGGVVRLLANGLVGTGFVSRYRLQNRVVSKRDKQNKIIVIQQRHLTINGGVVRLLANGLVGTGFVSRYRLQNRVVSKRDKQNKIIVIQQRHLSINGGMVRLLANVLVGTGFVSRYRLQQVF